MSRPKKEDREFRDYLMDILESVADIQNFTSDITYKELEKDKKTLYAVIRCFEVLGEAVKKIPQDIRKKHSDVPWEEMAGMRDKLIHEYFGVDVETLWDTIEEDLPSLKDIVSKIVDNLR